MDSENEKRKHPRVEVNWPVTIYYEDEKIEGESKNISAEGLSVCTENPLPLKKILSISIKPPEHESLDLKGEVVWSDLYGINGTGKSGVYGLGVCLVELSEENRQLIGEMLSNYL